MLSASSGATARLRFLLLDDSDARFWEALVDAAVEVKDIDDMRETGDRILVNRCRKWTSVLSIGMLTTKRLRDEVSLAFFGSCGRTYA